MFEQSTVPTHTMIQQAVIFAGRAIGSGACVLLQIPISTQPPENGVHGALLRIGKSAMETAQQVIAVLVLLREQVEQAQLNQVFFQHKATPVQMSPAAAVTAHRSMSIWYWAS